MLTEAVSKKFGYNFRTAQRVFKTYTNVKDEVLRREYKTGSGNGAIQFYGADAEIGLDASYYTSRGLKIIDIATHYYNVGMLNRLEKTFHQLRSQRRYYLPKGVSAEDYTLSLQQYTEDDYVQAKSSFRINDGRPYFSRFEVGSIMLGSRSNDAWGIRDFLLTGIGYAWTLVWTPDGNLGVFWDFVLLDDSGSIQEYFASQSNDEVVSDTAIIFTPQRNLQKDESTIRHCHDIQIVTAHHVTIQRKLGDILVALYGIDAVAEEWVVSDARRIDTAVLKNADTKELAIYEVKTATTAKECVKQALGQLSMYAYLGGLDDYYISELTVVGPASADEKVDVMLQQLSDEQS